MCYVDHRGVRAAHKIKDVSNTTVVVCIHFTRAVFSGDHMRMHNSRGTLNAYRHVELGDVLAVGVPVLARPVGVRVAAVLDRVGRGGGNVQELAALDGEADPRVEAAGDLVLAGELASANREARRVGDRDGLAQIRNVIAPALRECMVKLMRHGKVG